MIVTFSVYIDSYVCDDVEVCEDDTDSENSSDTEDKVSAPNFPESDVSHSEANTLVLWVLIFILRIQAKHYIPDTALQCLLKFLFVFFSIVGRTN